MYMSLKTSLPVYKSLPCEASTMPFHFPNQAWAMLADARTYMFKQVSNKKVPELQKLYIYIWCIEPVVYFSCWLRTKAIVK